MSSVSTAFNLSREVEQSTAGRCHFQRRFILLVICGTILAGFVLAGVLAPWLAPYNPQTQALTERLQPPVWQSDGNTTHLLGTDHLGRDVLSRLLYGARVSLLVVATAVPVAATLGALAGLVAGYFGGWLDRVLMRLVDAQLAFPAILFAIFLAGLTGPSLRNVLVVFITFGWVMYARVIRSEVLSLTRRDFVVAATVVGASPVRVMVRHIAPNVLHLVVVLATLNVAVVILAEAALSFLGVGVPFTTTSWGGMISEGRSYVTLAWWLAAIPGAAIAVVALASNLLGDWLRDEMDPHLRGTR